MTPSRIAPRRAIAGAALLAASSLLAACGTSGGQAAPTTTVTVSATSAGQIGASGAPATPGPLPSQTAPASSAPSGPAPCPTRDLKVKLGLSQGGAGSIYQIIIFKNIGAATCTLYGYPGVSLGGGSPVTQIGLPAKEDPSTPRQLVTLARKASANVVLRIVQAANFPPSKCGLVNASYLVIYPPNQTTPVYFAYKAQTCSKHVRTMSVTVVKAGTGG